MPQTAVMSLNIVLPGNYVCKLHIDTLNISESFYGALFYLQALKSCEKATKPVYVSPGHKISIDSATELVHRCSKYRVPEPIRQVNPIDPRIQRGL